MALSDDLRDRVVEAVVRGGMSRNAAAPHASPTDANSLLRGSIRKGVGALIGRRARIASSKLSVGRRVTRAVVSERSESRGDSRIAYVRIENAWPDSCNRHQRFQWLVRWIGLQYYFAKLVRRRWGWRGANRKRSTISPPTGA